MSEKYFTSPQRFEFLKRSREKSLKDGLITPEQYQDWLSYIARCRSDDADPHTEKQPSLETDLRYSQHTADKCKESEVYSQNLYAALCNNQFKKGNTVWSCSWRHAGGIVSNLREEGDYINWYCSGIGSESPYVAESVVTEEIRRDIEGFGWSIVPYNIEQDLT